MNCAAFWKGFGRHIKRGRDFNMARALPRQRPRRETVYGEIYDPAEDREELPKPPAKTQEQMDMLMNRIRTTAFLKEIDEPRLKAALSHMTRREVKPGEIIMRQGDLGDHFYVVEKGEFQTYVRAEDDDPICFGDPDKTYKDDGCFGELALLYMETREFTVKAVTAGVIWQIARRLYTRVVVKMAYLRRQRYMKYLDSVFMLSTVEPYEKVRLCDAFEPRVFKKGETIMKEGGPADGMYFVEEGEVELKRKDKTQVLDKGTYFGEHALLVKTPREETAVAKSDEVICAFLEAEALDRLLGKLNDLLKRDKAICKRVAQQLFKSDTIPADKLR
ncbi:cAMP-dependent protein kinase type II regulatory subunit [Galendromus occidentalis]|uniref:cAMP-dependent protein kinase type II regulatory subunit n=1 Tax=Galendromus occidentalis TaxID=34638 RepID=A0AAJ7L4E2_9ACAR|nr:cAMP-dependent protein kinase type II regulatory subunit [Galendromus occidentalis]